MACDVKYILYPLPPLLFSQPEHQPQLHKHSGKQQASKQDAGKTNKKSAQHRPAPTMIMIIMREERREERGWYEKREWQAELLLLLPSSSCCSLLLVPRFQRRITNSSRARDYNAHRVSVPVCASRTVIASTAASDIHTDNIACSCSLPDSALGTSCCRTHTHTHSQKGTTAESRAHPCARSPCLCQQRRR